MNWVNSVFSSDESPKTSSIRNSIRKNSLFNSVSGLTSNKPTVCNDLVDSVLNYIKNNYVHKFDPFIYDKEAHTNIGNYGQFSYKIH